MNKEDIKGLFEEITVSPISDYQAELIMKLIKNTIKYTVGVVRSDSSLEYQMIEDDVLAMLDYH